MREIKFRVWDSRKNEFKGNDFVCIEQDGDLIELDGQDKELLSRERHKIMQYTGIKDKNGKEIYEGDILNHHTYVRSNVFRRGVVCFDEKQCTYKFVPHEAYESNAGNGGWSGFAFDYHICLEAEIFGNIYEKPEILAVMET